MRWFLISLLVLLALPARAETVYVSNEQDGTVTVIAVPNRMAVGVVEFEVPGVRHELVQPVGSAPWGVVVAP